MATIDWPQFLLDLGCCHELRIADWWSHSIFGRRSRHNHWTFQNRKPYVGRRCFENGAEGLLMCFGALQCPQCISSNSIISQHTPKWRGILLATITLIVGRRATSNNSRGVQARSSPAASTACRGNHTKASTVFQQENQVVTQVGKASADFSYHHLLKLWSDSQQHGKKTEPSQYSVG